MTDRVRLCDLDGLARATAHLDPPLAALDVGALRANAADLVRRAGGKPVRVASKSVRCLSVLRSVLLQPGFAGVMAYAVREAAWLAREGVQDVLLGYPTVDVGGLADLTGDRALLDRVTLMVDDIAQLDAVRAVSPRARVRVCLDVDASLRVGRVHLGVRRSPVRTVADAVALARAAEAQGFAVVGVMFYEAQIAGLPDTSPLVRFVKHRSAAELRERRGRVVEAVEKAVGALQFVNSGGTGSLEVSSADPAVTEVTAGSGLFVPTLFDGYRAFEPRPSLYFALPVVRRPAPDIATLFGGGYAASGPAGASRLPSPALAGLRLLRAEGAGEVQTPVAGAAAAALKIGDRVWFRHAKAGELAERFDRIHVVEDGAITSSVPTYRGEGRNFG